MAKPVIKFKTYRQSAQVGGKIYGVPNLGDPVVANVTMAEVIDYAKLHNYSADTLEALLSQVISGVADLVARDGRPRNLSALLKFEPVIKGTFENLEQTVTTQKVLVRPRLLKEIRVKLDPSQYSWQNINDNESPRLISVAPASTIYLDMNAATFNAALSNSFGWTYAGARLCPNGWDANCSFAVILRKLNSPVPGVTDFHFERLADFVDSGFFRHTGGEATDNAIAFSASAGSNGDCWYMNGDVKTAYDSSMQAVAGDTAIFQFTRALGTGDIFTVEKRFVL